MVVGALYFLVALLLQAPARRAAAEEGLLESWLDTFTSARMLFAAMILVPLFALFAAGRSRLVRLVLGVLHALGHLLLALTVVVAWAHLWDTRGLVIATLAAAVATPLGGALIGAYLALSDLAYSVAPKRLEGLNRHANEAFSCQGIEDWKSFLRFHIDSDGRLTIYPIGIERVARARDLSFNRTDDPGAPYFSVSDRVRRPTDRGSRRLRSVN